MPGFFFEESVFFFESCVEGGAWERCRQSDLDVEEGGFFGKVIDGIEDGFVLTIEADDEAGVDADACSLDVFDILVIGVDLFGFPIVAFF